jgi:hypothetical protein
MVPPSSNPSTARSEPAASGDDVDPYSASVSILSGRSDSPVPVEMIMAEARELGEERAMAAGRAVSMFETNPGA